MTAETESRGSERVDFECRYETFRPDADDPELVSVVIPAYNAENFIGKTLLSVMTQSYTNLEVIVVDDGSQDETARVVEDLGRQDNRVRLVRQKNGGVGAARNLGIANTRGAFIAPLDSDDLWHRDKVALQVEALRTAPPKVSVAYCWWVPIDEQDAVKSNGRVPYPCQFEGNVFDELAVQNFVGNGSVPLIRRSALCEIGGYDPDRILQACADWKLYLQLAERGEFVLVRRALVGYRQFSGSMSTAFAPMERAWNATVQWVRKRHPRLPRTIIRRQKFHGNAYLFVLALKRQSFISALRYMSVAAANGPGRFSCVLFNLVLTRSRRFIKGRSRKSASSFQVMTTSAS